MIQHSSPGNKIPAITLTVFFWVLYGLLVAFVSHNPLAAALCALAVATGNILAFLDIAPGAVTLRWSPWLTFACICFGTGITWALFPQQFTLSPGWVIVALIMWRSFMPGKAKPRPRRAKDLGI